MANLPVVAVVNTNPDFVELIKVRLEAAGFVVLDDGVDIDVLVQAVREAARARPTS